MAIERSFVDLNNIHGFSPLLKSYLEEDGKLSLFYRFAPTLSGYKQSMESIVFSKEDRILLADILAGQYKSSAISPGKITASNIEKLCGKNTYTVCTGHQLCLFTGPLFFIYKIISTINLAEKLSKEFPESNFVPVYWMASEDHDFEEINHVNIFGKKIIWSSEDIVGNEQEGKPAGIIPTSSLNKIIEQLKEILGSSENANHLLQLIEESYTAHNNLADATRSFVNALFGEYGLVILDARDQYLKAKFEPVMKDEILRSSNHKLVSETVVMLEKIGFPAQVNPREINLFYLSDGKRLRMERKADRTGFNVVGGNRLFTEGALLKELQEHPELFSPNVVLRPLYQQVILPNIAYVGGPGELAYWLEYKKMFDHHQIHFPVLTPRNFVMWIDERSAMNMKKMNLTVADLSGTNEQVEKTFLSGRLSSAEQLNAERDKLQSLYEQIILKAGTSDQSLIALAEAELQKVLNGLKNLESKMARAVKLKHETELNQLKKVKEKLFPGGILQERVENFMPIYLSHGAHFIDTLKKNLDPFEKRMIILSEG